MDQNIVVRTIGRRDGIPASVQREMDKTIELSSGNSGTRLCLAINYGGRGELLDAVREIARQARDGQLDPETLTEDLLSKHLYTGGMPDPDLLVRTAGEMRVSNFLLWQISYAELWVTEKCWPEFQESDLHNAIRDFANRQRRFGGLNESISPTGTDSEQFSV